MAAGALTTTTTDLLTPYKVLLRLLGLLDLVECQHKDVCLDLKGATLQTCGGPQIRGYCKRAEVIVNCN